ncbi:MAG: hypothetical protein NT003_01130 [Candidatus Magasanikbacteria bacterium]|nr:hypothetical protein [Candidatus Magasanikbacteria bacterium]
MPQAPQQRPRTKKVIPLPPVENTSSRDIENTLEDMYQDTDGSLPDMTHIEHKGSRAGFVAFLFILFFMAAAAAAAWLGFFVFSPSKKFSEDQILAAIVTPEKIVDGVDGTYTITVRNTGSLALATTQVDLKMPDGFIVTTSTPAATSDRNDRWALGSIDASASKTITFTGIYAQPQGTQDSLRAYVDFKPSNFNSEFEKIADAPVVIAANAILLDVAKTGDNSNPTFTVKYKNISDTEISNDAIKLEAGQKFRLSTTDPTITILDGAINYPLASLAAGADGTLIISGNYPTSSTLPDTISTTFNRVVGNKDLAIAKNDLPFAAATSTTNATGNAPIAAQPTSTKSFSITPSSSKVIPGNAILFTIRYKNTTTAPITNAIVTVVATAPSIANKSIFDFTKLNTVGDPDVMGKQLSPDSRQATITWTPDKTDLLKSVAPGQTITINATVVLKKLDQMPTTNIATFGASLSADGGVKQTADVATVTIGG